MRIKDIAHLIMFKIVPYKAAIKLEYAIRFRKKLDFNMPQTLYEKIMVLRWLYKKKYRKCICNLYDKYTVRDYVQNKIGEQYLTELYGIYDNTEEIDFSSLPNKFVIKGTQGCGHNVICSDKEKLDIQTLRKTLKHWLKLEKYVQRFIFPDGWMQNGKARILCEEYLEPDYSTVPDDIKIFCFNGNVEFIYMMHHDIDENGKRLTTGIGNIYDVDWNYIPVKRGLRTDKNFDFKKPENIKEIIHVAETLSEDFPFVRVDLYNINNKIYFGELTFIPGAEPMTPMEYEYKFGQNLILPK